MSHPATCLAIYPLPVLASQPWACQAAPPAGGAPGPPAGTAGAARAQPVVVLGAALSTGGQLQLLSWRQGGVSPLAVELAACLSPHAGE
jgi:hypothetical protein